MPAKIAAVALSWLVLICWAHIRLNGATPGRRTIRMGYMPVVTNLAAPLIDSASLDGPGLRFEAIKFSSFADMGAALRDGYIDAGFIIAPLAIVMRQQGVDVKVVYIGNRHESTFVVRNELDVREARDLAGLKIAVPMRYSGHNLALRKMAEEAGLSEGSIDIVEMNPPDMGAALKTGELDGYLVGEPFAGLTVRKNDSRVFQYLEEGWPGFVCNLVLVRRELIDERGEDVRTLVESAARAGIWAKDHPQEAARIAADYWSSDVELAEYVLTSPKDRVVYDRFVPVAEELQYMADLMVRYELLEDGDITGLVYDGFAREASLEAVTSLESIVAAPQP